MTRDEAEEAARKISLRHWDGTVESAELDIAEAILDAAKVATTRASGVVMSWPHQIWDRGGLMAAIEKEAEG